MKLNVHLGDQRVGQLRYFEGSHYFEYDVRFLRGGLEISPFALPLERGVSKHSNSAFSTLPPVIADSLPGKFGRTVILESFKKLGRPSPSPMEVLAYLGSQTMGALTYEPAEGGKEDSAEIDLVTSAQAARQALEQVHEDELDLKSLRAGQTAGGMAPKLLAAISDDGRKLVTGANVIPENMEAWLIKLNSKRMHESSSCQIEMAYFDLARLAGIEVPETKLITDREGYKHFAIQRFDRNIENPNERIHLHSFAGLMGLDFNDPNHDYDYLLRTTRAITKNAAQVEQQFRRMVFNLLASVRDDHAKNFSFLMADGGEWSISPAYDLLYSDTELGGNWTLVDGLRSNVTFDHLNKLADTHSIPRRKVISIVDSVCDALAHWPSAALKSGVGPAVIATVANVHNDMIQSLKRE